MSLYEQGLLKNPEPRRDLYKEGFSHSLQAAATEFKKLCEPKVAKFKGGYSFDASLGIPVMAERHPGIHLRM